MEELVRYIIAAVLDGEEFEIATDNSNPKYDVIRVKVSDDNVGKIIGRNGKVITSIRTILRSANPRSNKRVVLKINE